jgi:hypothetical protein
MKEICAQCLQVHRDPATGVESVVFSCFNQDQDLDRVDFANLRARLAQNGVQEKLTRLWIDRSLRQLGLRPPRSRRNLLPMQPVSSFVSHRRGAVHYRFPVKYRENTGTPGAAIISTRTG